jgi:hypothetical protein
MITLSKKSLPSSCDVPSKNQCVDLSTTIFGSFRERWKDMHTEPVKFVYEIFKGVTICDS